MPPYPRPRRPLEWRLNPLAIHDEVVIPPPVQAFGEDLHARVAAQIQEAIQAYYADRLEAQLLQAQWYARWPAARAFNPSPSEARMPSSLATSSAPAPKAWAITSTDICYGSVRAALSADPLVVFPWGLEEADLEALRTALTAAKRDVPEAPPAPAFPKEPTWHLDLAYRRMAAMEALRRDPSDATARRHLQEIAKGHLRTADILTGYIATLDRYSRDLEANRAVREKAAAALEVNKHLNRWLAWTDTLAARRTPERPASWPADGTRIKTANFEGLLESAYQPAGWRMRVVFLRGAGNTGWFTDMPAWWQVVPPPAPKRDPRKDPRPGDVLSVNDDASCNRTIRARGKIGDDEAVTFTIGYLPSTVRARVLSSFQADAEHWNVVTTAT